MKTVKLVATYLLMSFSSKEHITGADLSHWNFIEVGNKKTV